ncbi:MAG: histidine kinase [Mycobacteriales bacterium]
MTRVARRAARAVGRRVVLVTFAFSEGAIVLSCVAATVGSKGALTFLLLLCLAMVSRGYAFLRRRIATRWSRVPIAPPYRTRPALERSVHGWYWTGFDYHKRRWYARISLWFNWLVKDPATYRDLLWLVLDPPVGGVLAVLAPLRWHGRWTRLLLGPTAGARLRQRVDRLTETRSDAADAQAAELRRIERDLHDGAQARLVATGIALGAIEHLMDRDPAAAKVLVAKARETSAAALAELRDLVRGIHPPVLAERGLTDAVRALALDSPLKVEVTVDLPGRPEQPVESAAYFAVAEALANVGKHAKARRVRIGMSHDGRALRITVADDGRGGADPAAGGGLRGIARRLGTFDGVLAVSSPPGGPTDVTMEIPCVLSSPRTSTC